jgi:hypothetical protein
MEVTQLIFILKKETYTLNLKDFLSNSEKGFSGFKFID